MSSWLGTDRARAAEVDLCLLASRTPFLGRSFDDADQGKLFSSVNYRKVFTPSGAVAECTGLKAVVSHDTTTTAVGIDCGAVLFHVSLCQLAAVTAEASRRSARNDEVGNIGHSTPGRGNGSCIRVIPIGHPCGPVGGQ